MNQLDLIIVVGRVIERLLLTGSGLACLILGFRLAGTVIADKSSFEGQLNTISVKIQRIGPGVSFAIIGLILLYISSTMHIETSNGLRALGSGPASISLEITDPQIRALHLATQAMRTLDNIDPAEKLEIATNLQRLRSAAIASRYQYTDEQVLEAISTSAESDRTLTEDERAHIRYLWGLSDEQ